MAIVRARTSYTNEIVRAVRGQIANTQTCDVDTYLVEDSAGVPFGIACQLGTSPQHVKLGIAANKFIGISVKDTTLDPSDDDKYDEGTHASIIYRGDIWVAAGAAVTAGQDVSAVTTTGVLSSAAAASTQIVIAGARWMTTQATAGGLAIVRLSGELPTA